MSRVFRQAGVGHAFAMSVGIAWCVCEGTMFDVYFVILILY